MASKMPAFFLSHGGGPCFFLKEASGPFAHMGPNSTAAAWYRNFHKSFVPRKPSAIVIFSAHWEESKIKITSTERNELLFDYYGFPDYTYELKYPCPGSPQLASRIARLLTEAGVPTELDTKRGLDHGVFVPLLLMYPDADIPVVQVSLHKSLDPALHTRLGELLDPLRSEDVLFLGSGFATHNLREIFAGEHEAAWAREWDTWLHQQVTGPKAKSEAGGWQYEAMKASLAEWQKGPHARRAHPREEHLIPLMIAAGFANASATPPQKIMSEIWGSADFASFKFD